MTTKYQGDYLPRMKGDRQARNSWPVRHPVVLGHEFCGTVREVGHRVRGFAPGDRVVCETHAIVDPDGPLAQGRALPARPRPPGLRGYRGRRDAAHDAGPGPHPPPPSPPPAGRARRPHGAGLRGVQRGGGQQRREAGRPRGRPRSRPDRDPVRGDGPAVRGGGRDRGARGGRAPPRGGGRLRLLRFRSGAEALRDWARGASGAGVDGVVDASSDSAALREAMELVRPAGFVTKVGWGPQPLGFSLDPIVQKAVRLQGSFSHNWPVWERVIALLGRARLDVAPLVGGVFPLREWKAAFEKMEEARSSRPS